MLDSIPSWVQIISVLIVFGFIIWGLRKIVKENWLRAAILSGLILSGIFTSTYNIGAGQWAGDFIMAFSAFVVVYFFAFILTQD